MEDAVSWVSMADGFPKGTICVCPDCWRPVYALERGISLGDRGGRSASAFRPLTRQDLALLVERHELDAHWRILLKAWLETPNAERVLQAPRPKAGDPAICPNCGGTWVKVEERERGSALDRGYVLQLLDIPPSGRSAWMNRTRWARDDISDLPVSRGETIHV